ncbi:hypothetical protein BC940DRAFT_311474 [Gongronella butleri]|nr:hypothetical protein BC940DRAFT_311474 [Gongronella butleri]
MFKPSAEHSFYVRALYKRVLSETLSFFDDRARTFMVNRARRLFREYKTCQDEQRIRNKLLETRKRLHRVERANQMHGKSVVKLLEAAYGRTGKVKHRLLYPYLHDHIPPDLPRPQPFVPHVPHTAPPMELCEPLKALVRQDLGKALTPKLPEPSFKPLHPGRKANLLWQWRSMLITRLSPPLPMEIVTELEGKAGAPKTHPLAASQMQQPLRGGPHWMDLYDRFADDPDLCHLCPNATLLPRKTTPVRRQPMPSSPFSKPRDTFDASTLLAELQERDPTLDLPDALVDNDKASWTPRRVRRFYRRLLVEIPLVSPLPSAHTLYDKSIAYKVYKSTWMANSPTTTPLDPRQLPPDYDQNPNKITKTR